MRRTYLTSRFNIAPMLFTISVLFFLSFRNSEAHELDWKNPQMWESDGMWKISYCEEGLKFLKDEKAAHNSMCWMKLDKPLKRGQIIEITYKMEVPFKHIDMYLGYNCIWPPR